MRHREAPIVIHTHHYRDAFAALLARKLARKTPKQVRIVCTHHNCRAALEGRLMRRIYRNLDAFIFVSRLAARRFLSRWPHGRIPFSENKIHILHPFILHSDLPNLRPFPEKGPFSLLYLGRISPEKGIERLIRAMSLLKGKRIRLTIAGTGYADYVDSLHNLAIREGVDNLIDWKGWDDSPMERILDCHAGICVSPREEPFSLASLEMMACGRSQIIPPDGAFDEYMHPATIQDLQTEPLPPLTDSLRLTRISETTIAEAILTLAEQRHICTTLGQNALNNFRNLPTTSDAVTLLRKIYLNL